MKQTFAGFWRDGAKVKPTEKHCDERGYLLLKDKTSGNYDVAGLSFIAMEDHYWLDTTTPTELTPQQAFELLKVVFPKAKRIIRDSAFAITFDCDGDTSIVWGETTEYPPREHWRVPTDADKGKRCRCKRTLSRDWTDCKFICCFNNRFVVWCEDSLSCEQYDICEVLD
jgi:hypothetical protein